MSSTSPNAPEWSIFDSILSIHWGKRFQTGRDPSQSEKQTAHLNRCLTQLVESEDEDRLLLPEAYFFEKDGYVPKDHLPLQWAHAVLWRGISALRASAKLTSTAS